MSIIPLAKGYDPKKLNWPVLASHKIDGVPVRIDINKHGSFTVRSRQDKPVLSVGALVQSFVDDFLGNSALGYCDTPVTLVGEVHLRNQTLADFKEVSGIVRRQYDQSDQLAIALFECDLHCAYLHRVEHLYEIGYLNGNVWAVPQTKFNTREELEAFFDRFCDENPKAEGLIARSWDDGFEPGKRSWGYQKMLREPTIDLEIVDIIEAKSKDGISLGMAGGLVARYKGTEIGIGPGKLTHKERTDLWARYKVVTGRGRLGIAQIKYKADESYDALRQPTFQYWRPEKVTPDA